MKRISNNNIKKNNKTALKPKCTNIKHLQQVCSQISEISAR